MARWMFTLSINEVTSDGIKYYTVMVEDNGPGIPDPQKNKLFNQLHCEDKKTQSKGLGLCLIKALVDIFHGKVRVEDRVPGDHKKAPGSWSCFQLSRNNIGILIFSLSNLISQYRQFYINVDNSLLTII